MYRYKSATGVMDEWEQRKDGGKTLYSPPTIYFLHGNAGNIVSGAIVSHHVIGTSVEKDKGVD